MTVCTHTYTFIHQVILQLMKLFDLSPLTQTLIVS